MESVLDVPRNLPLKFHQNQVSNSWDIPGMDKCHRDNWNLFSLEIVSIILSWGWPEKDFAYPPPTTETQCQHYRSCYWPDFDETLKVGSWEHLEQIPTVTGTFVRVTFIHIKNISAVIDPILMEL